MISISGGLIITRTSSETKLGIEFQKQVFSNPHPLLLASGVLIAMAAFSGLPKIPFLVFGRRLGRHGVAHAAKKCHGRQDQSAGCRTTSVGES
jgi:flagellar biosynthesis protein FlhA